MTLAAPRKPFLSVGARVVFGASLLLGVLAAPAFAAESPTAVSGTAPLVKGATGRQLWRIADYTTVELVAREPGTPDNQHPFALEPNTLHAWLQQVQLVEMGRDGLPRPLFAIDELRNIVPALADALAHARPDQDVALVSSARHEDNTFYGLTAVSARLFAYDGHLNLIVHDARNDFYDTARGSGMAPHFTPGSRTAPGSARIQSPTGTNKRGDWLVLDTVAAAAPAPTPAVAPYAPMAPAPAAVAPVAVAPVAPVAPVVTPTANDAEQRLLTLKRLYDKGLITKPEYEKKRAEILKSL